MLGIVSDFRGTWQAFSCVFTSYFHNSRTRLIAVHVLRKRRKVHPRVFQINGGRLHIFVLKKYFIFSFFTCSSLFSVYLPRTRVYLSFSSISARHGEGALPGEVDAAAAEFGVCRDVGQRQGRDGLLHPQVQPRPFQLVPLPRRENAGDMH